MHMSWWWRPVQGVLAVIGAVSTAVFVVQAAQPKGHGDNRYLVVALVVVVLLAMTLWLELFRATHPAHAQWELPRFRHVRRLIERQIRRGNRLLKEIGSIKDLRELHDRFREVSHWHQVNVTEVNRAGPHWRLYIDTQPPTEDMMGNPPATPERLTEWVGVRVNALCEMINVPPPFTAAVESSPSITPTVTGSMRLFWQPSDAVVPPHVPLACEVRPAGSGMFAEPRWERVWPSPRTGSLEAHWPEDFASIPHGSFPPAPGLYDVIWRVRQPGAQHYALHFHSMGYQPL